MNTLILVTALATTGLVATTCHPDEPSPPIGIKTYIGDYEKRSICRIDEDGKEICVDTSVEYFNEFVCLHNDDMIKTLDYISRLRTSCKVWKK